MVALKISATVRHKWIVVLKIVQLVGYKWVPTISQKVKRGQVKKINIMTKVGKTSVNVKECNATCFSAQI